MSSARAAKVAIAAVLLAAGCADRRLTARAHEPQRKCTVRPDGKAILCGGETFASFDCQIRFHAGCTTLFLRYADGQVARLYEAQGDPKFDKAAHVTVASDGSRVWFLEIEGLSGARQWREYDVWSGVLKSMGSAEAGQVDAAIARGAAVLLGTEEQHAPSVQ